MTSPKKNSLLMLKEQKFNYKGSEDDNIWSLNCQPKTAVDKTYIKLDQEKLLQAE